MKTKLTLILFLIVIGFSAWYFDLLKPKGDKSLANLIPQSSIGLIVTNNPQAAINELAAYPWWNTVQNIPFISQSVDQFKNIQSLIDSQQLQSKLNQLEHALSLHITGNDQIETLHFVKSMGFSWSKPAIEELILKLWPESSVSTIERIFEGVTIHELSFDAGQFTFIIMSDYLVYSSNAILVEDVIRTNSQQRPSFFENYPQVRLDKKKLNLYIKTGKLRDIERVFFKQDELSEFEEIEGLLQLEFSGNDALIALTGLINSADPVSTKEVSFSEGNYLPNSLSSVSMMPLANGSEESLEIPGFDLKKFRLQHEGSVTIVELDAGVQQHELVVLAKIKNEIEVQNNLNDLALRLVQVETDTLYQEQFSNRFITFLNKTNIVTDFYGERLPKFGQAYYSVLNNTLIIGESVEAVKLILSEYDDENTWGKTIARRKVLDDLIQQTVYTKLINFQFSVDALKERLKPKWSGFLEDQQPLLDLIDLISIQLSKSGNGYYSSTQLALNPLGYTPSTTISTSDENGEANFLVANTFAETTISTRPFVVKNHNDNSQQEVFFQDIGNNIYLISKEGTILWKKQLNLRINGGVSQIDFYNNRRLQYLFVTDSDIYVLDRNGNDVEGFPRPLNTDLPLLGTAAVDYDNSKRYRYAGYDRRGNTYLFDKNGNPLEGWSPKVGSASLIEIPRHLRVRGKDCFVFVREDGTIELTNRRGANYPGFPVSFDKRLAGDFKLSQGPDFKRTTITVTTEEGQQLVVDLNGQVKSRNQLFKPSLSSKFSLVDDKLGTDHVVLRRDENKTVFFDAEGQELFTSDLVLSDEAEVTYYNFRNESEIFLIRERGELHVLDTHGKEKLKNSIKTDFDAGLVYYQSRGEYELFVNFENQFAIYKFAK